MFGIRPKQHAWMGQFHLEEAALDAWLETKQEDNCIGSAEISRRSGIFRERGDVNPMNDAIATGAMTKLADERRMR